MGYYKLTILCEEFTEEIEGDDFKLPNAANQAFAFFYKEDEGTYEAYKSLQLHWHTTS